MGLENTLFDEASQALAASLVRRATLAAIAAGIGLVAARLLPITLRHILRFEQDVVAVVEQFTSHTAVVLSAFMCFSFADAALAVVAKGHPDLVRRLDLIEGVALWTTIVLLSVFLLTQLVITLAVALRRTWTAAKRELQA